MNEGRWALGPLSSPQVGSGFDAPLEEPFASAGITRNLLRVNLPSFHHHSRLGGFLGSLPSCLSRLL